MQVIRTAADTTTDPELHNLIAQVFATVSDCPEILGLILIAEPGDTIATLDAKLGFQILASRCEIIIEHANWYELVYVLGQDGGGCGAFVPKVIDLPELIAMCVQQAVPVERTP